MWAEGGKGVHAALEDPPEEELLGMHAEGGTGVHAAPKSLLKKIPLACMPQAVRAFTPPSALGRKPSA